MRGSRFVFLSGAANSESRTPTATGVLWVLVSPNNRRLGRSRAHHPTYELCRRDVLRIQRAHDDLIAVTAPEQWGHWAWRLELRGEVLAVSARGYLRQQECDYNLRRFLDALPSAEIAPVVRTVRIGQISTVTGRS